LKEIRACGSWESPIGSADLVRGALRLSAPRLDGGLLYWLEGRPDEGGRQVVMAGELSDSGSLRSLREVSPEGHNVRTRVHEYGGGEYVVAGSWLFYVEDGDRSLYAGPIDGEKRRLASTGAHYADLTLSPDRRWLVAVEERPREGSEPENRLVAFRLPDSSSAGRAGARVAPSVVAAGRDFYASPAFAPAGDRLVWLAWDHPNMPWNGTCLEQIGWGSEGVAGGARVLAGGVAESLFQPRFSPSGRLYAISDRSGWWNLVAVTESGSEPIQRLEAELGRPQWAFGLSTWAFLGEREVLASATVSGLDELMRIDLESGAARRVSTPFCQVMGVEASEGWATWIAGSPDRAAGLYVWRLEAGAPSCVRESSTLAFSDSAVSVAEARSIESVDGRETHAFVYSPRSQTARIGPGERPPLLVKSHGGPTSATSAALDPRIQFWTSRGFAVVDVNYGGSSGYGRAYRDRLRGAWGVVDVEDCIAAARALAAEGLVDPARLAISGGSAGGYTTLCALTFHDVFSAGASHYGIGDLEALARDTHKFESRYMDWLVGPLPRERDRYVERSPVHHPERLATPVIFFQGLEDRVVPPSQAEEMVAVLARRGISHAYVPFEGEQHGFRRAENIRTALDGELYFYSRLFGFEAPRPADVNVVVGVA
jgi:dipeptidyl aminopeptidase/acylaminoacyl peptidase